ncbi:MAG: 2,3-bisphosphoglycerate-independent phosphoglycerate mutase [Chloroflexota bacterium]
MDLDVIQRIRSKADTKMLLLVLDGLGGLPFNDRSATELEVAETPNLDALASRSICGLQVPVASGITPGSGPGHLALFGYDPIKYQIGRGVLTALGIDFDLQPGDVAARGNFCTVDEDGNVTDRRAGRISTEKNQELCDILRQIALPDAELIVKTVKEHRFLFVLRGQGLSGDVHATDPQRTGIRPHEPHALTDRGQHTAELIRNFLNQAAEKLQDHQPANMILLRGFASLPDWPTITDVFGVRGVAIAAYPMYRGVSKLVGMDITENPDDLSEEVKQLERRWDDYDFFYLHVKQTDSAGEDGDFDRKVRLIEAVDDFVPRLLDLDPDVVVVTGDHSSPAALKSHSWHPVPVLLWSEHCRPDQVEQFHEAACLTGGLGPRLPAVDLMPLALANAMRLTKYGA